MTADGEHAEGLADLGAAEAARRIRDGEITSEDLVGACLARIEETDEPIQAWTYLNPDHALEQARQADAARQAGPGQGPLHGVPVAVKDIFDTRDMPTENGSPLDAGRTPLRDATVVSLLREAGAVIMGKTVTTEFAVYHPGKTANPHDPTRTPGGSSSGSTAAVAAGMAPLALGSQTNGSVIRPAAFCGVVGYKPTHGLISRHGILALSRPVDTVGVFARSVEDAALMADCLTAYDARDPDMAPHGRPRLGEVAAQEPPVTPSLAFVKSPVWDKTEPDTRAAFAELTEVLGAACDEVDLPEPFDRAVAMHRAIMTADLAKSLAPYYDRGREQISPVLRGMIEAGQTVTAVDYNRAVDGIEILNAGLDPLFDSYDAILTPAAAGEAPVGLDATGDPIFCTLWTLCGTPAISLPLLGGSNGMPMGAQLVGRRGDDARLLRTARWLTERVQSAAAVTR